jgi:hypothetical protein
MYFHSALISGSRSISALARSIVANRLAAGVMPFLNQHPANRATGQLVPSQAITARFE